MKLRFSSAAVLALALSFAACKKDEVNSSDKGSLKLEFDNIVGTEELIMSTGTYNKVGGEQFSVSKLKYYVSNIVLTKADGTTYTVPQANSYFLIDESVASSRLITLSDIPEADYTNVSFVLGVDSLRNTMDVSQRTGALDVGAGGAGQDMYWSWNSGYIFFKMEGYSPQAPLDSATNTHPFYYHIGGYGGYNTPTINNLRTVSLSTGSDKAEVRDDQTPQVHIEVDLAKVFTGTTDFNIADHPNVMMSQFSLTISNNYKDMFKIAHVHND